MFATRGVAELKAHPFFKGIDWQRLAARQVPAPAAVPLASPTDTSNFDPYFTSQPLTTDWAMLSQQEINYQLQKTAKTAATTKSPRGVEKGSSPTGGQNNRNKRGAAAGASPRAAAGVSPESRQSPVAPGGSSVTLPVPSATPSVPPEATRPVPIAAPRVAKSSALTAQSGISTPSPPEVHLYGFSWVAPELLAADTTAATIAAASMAAAALCANSGDRALFLNGPCAQRLVTSSAEQQLEATLDSLRLDECQGADTDPYNRTIPSTAVPLAC